ncbi:beta 1-4 rhamnosyltransferase Cps2T [Rossellomorea sp. FS2]|uniref:beta 1-4 rhamnosyltransferase Cps2T n=1 Tax=Rossellomorea sp. FS2 TaxID=3391447 RepID=UPI003A4DA845
MNNKNVFIIGSKGIPAKYGGFETFVDNLVQKRKSSRINYFVTCLSNENSMFKYSNATCININVPNIGGATAVLYDLKSLMYILNFIQKENLKGSTIYILASRIGPFLGMFKNKLRKLGVSVYLNPDGLEWKRSKWNWAIRKYWRVSEKLMVKNSELIICDSKEIRRYIEESYKKYTPNTTYISYGANTINRDNLEKQEMLYSNWLTEKSLIEKDYYLIVGRFVPENNYKLMIQEFMESKTSKSLVIVTNNENNMKYYNELANETSFETDKRIRFVGTIYDQSLLTLVRFGAFAYIHGHEVGGTNPSLLESLSTTQLNLLLNVNFNSEVAEKGALYFSKLRGDLSKSIESAENLSETERESIHEKAICRIRKAYTWDKIVNEYEELFLQNPNKVR